MAEPREFLCGHCGAYIREEGVPPLIYLVFIFIYHKIKTTYNKHGMFLNNEQSPHF